MSLEDLPEDAVNGEHRQPPLLSVTSSSMQPKLGGLVLSDVSQEAGPLEGFDGVSNKPGAGNTMASKVCGHPISFASAGEVCGPFYQSRAVGVD